MIELDEKEYRILMAEMASHIAELTSRGTYTEVARQAVWAAAAILDRCDIYIADSADARRAKLECDSK